MSDVRGRGGGVAVEIVSCVTVEVVVSVKVPVSSFCYFRQGDAYLVEQLPCTN